MANVLVLGGSYFAGRVFVMMATRSDYQITLINRGRYSMLQYPGVTEYKCDRRDLEQLAKLPLQEHYDAVIDFCAYEPGDIKGAAENLPCSFDKYIYLSTADVYQRTGDIRDEQTPLVTVNEKDRVGDYLYKKMLLEGELTDVAKAKGFHYTILRPSFIYGPYNYAPRESFYIEKIYRKQPLPIPQDATGKFQMVYVKDVANTIIACVENEAANDQAYNLAAPEILDYNAIITIFDEVSSMPFFTQEFPVEQILKNNLPLPYPLTEEESELFNGEKVQRELGIVYTTAKDGLQITFDGLKNMYVN